MNRANFFGTLIILVLLATASAQKSSLPEWKTLEPGVQVLRLWESLGPDQPQIAILQLTNEKYEKLESDPKGFLDRYNIFFESVRPGASLKRMLDAPRAYQGMWAVTCFHRESVARLASYPAEIAHTKQPHLKP
jgi:hypothetical protein